MPNIELEEWLTYDDVILVPRYSDISSRWEIDISTHVDRVMRLPLIGAPMDTVCGPAMCQALGYAGAVGVLHRYCGIEEQTEWYRASEANPIVAIGAAGDYKERFSALYQSGARSFCIDVAHGNHSHVARAIEFIKSQGDDIHVMAGNVGDWEGYRNLSDWGADSVRVGVGSGSCCTTQLVTGHGAAALGALLDITKNLNDSRRLSRRAKIVADGGIRKSGDIVKALAAGADAVMIGSLLAGTSESPSALVKTEIGTFKVFRGMASAAAQQDWRSRVSVEEGIETTVPYKGDVVKVLAELEAGIRSGFSYSGAHNMTQLKKNALFRKRSRASVEEGNPHALSKK